VCVCARMYSSICNLTKAACLQLKIKLSFERLDSFLLLCPEMVMAVIFEFLNRNYVGSSKRQTAGLNSSKKVLGY